MNSIWKNGIFGVVTGDALGCPVQFQDRAARVASPVTGMQGYGTFNLPSGSWTDDSSLTLALLDSICALGKIDPHDVMDRFTDWLDHGEYTPFGYAYDVGRGTMQAIRNYQHKRKVHQCGVHEEWNCGNGSLMRILPACLYCHEKGLTDAEAIGEIHTVGGLTHAHIRCNIACGLYYFMVCAVLDTEGTFSQRLQRGLERGFAYYEAALSDRENLEYYDRLRDLTAFALIPAEKIGSSGYVVDTLEAAVWSLITADSFESALLRAVNLGHDTDTVCAVAGGLAGLFYGYDAIPAEWIRVLQRREWIGEMCEKADAALKA